MKVSKQSLGTTLFCAWVVFMIMVFMNWPSNQFSGLLALTSILLMTHVFYAVFFAISRARQFTPNLIIWVLIGAASAIVVPFSFEKVWLYVLVYCVMFTAGIGMHKELLHQNVSASLNNLARYKIKLEAGIIALSLAMGLLIWLFPDSRTWFVGFSLLVLLTANAKLLLLDQIYIKWR